MIRIGRPFREHDPEERYDALVIGSGVGGLATAALLAKHGGKKVAVLERHYMPGGFTHVYLRNGYEWDVGVHYIGSVQEPGVGLRRLFDHVTDGTLDWAWMGDVYDRVVIEDRVYDFVAGPERFAARMKQYFPAEEEAIDRYLEILRVATRASGSFFSEKAMPAPLAGLLGGWMRGDFLRFARRTTAEVLAELTSDRELIAVLTGQFGDYGGPPGSSSFAMHAMLARHYLWGGSYPVGGSSRIAAAMAPLIEGTGGRVFFRAEVEEVLVERGRAVGVRMADGSELRAPLVISGAGAMNTYRRLLPSTVRSKLGLGAPLERVGESVGHLCLYVGFRRTAEELGLPKTNLWLYPGPDHDANVAAFLEDPEAPLPLVYVSFPSAKDPTFEQRYPGRATIELITLAPWKWFSRWRDTTWRRRGGEYEALKKALADRMLARLDEQIPGLREKIDYLEVSTPLSTRHFSNYERGEIYGLDHGPARFEERFLKPRTPIRGLLLTGQDVITCGVGGALAAGYVTASAALGRNLLKRAARGS